MNTPVYYIQMVDAEFDLKSPDFWNSIDKRLLLLEKLTGSDSCPKFDGDSKTSRKSPSKQVSLDSESYVFKRY